MVILMIDVVIQNFSISDDITLRQQQNILRRVSFVDGIMTANDCIKRSGIIARAYYDGLWGVATSSTINERSAKELLDKSMNNAKLLSSFSTSNKKRTYLPYSEQSIPAVDFLQIDYIDIEQSIIIDYAKRLINTFLVLIKKYVHVELCFMWTELKNISVHHLRICFYPLL